MEQFDITRILRTGFERRTRTWQSADAAILNASASGATSVASVADLDMLPAFQEVLGEVTVSMKSGFHTPPDSFNIESVAELRNAGSIVIGIEYRGRSILFAGDAVGHHGNNPTGPPIAIGSGHPRAGRAQQHHDDHEVHAPRAIGSGRSGVATRGACGSGVIARAAAGWHPRGTP